MLKFVKRYRVPLIVVALFLLPLVTYRAHATKPRDANLADRLVFAVSAPIERLLTWSTAFIADGWYTYVDLVGARRDNIEARRRSVRLEGRANEADALAAEHARLRDLLALRARRPELPTLAASVIAATSSPLNRGVRIDRGLLDGVQRGMPVIADEGLVGRIQRVGFNSAEVLLILDEKVSFGVMASSSRARGRASGRGLRPGPPIEVLGVPRTEAIALDDRIVTGGLAGLYPKDIAVGAVVGKKPMPGGSDWILAVQPAVDFTRLEHVLVVLYEERDEPVATPTPLLPPGLASGSTTATTAVMP